MVTSKPGVTPLGNTLGKLLHHENSLLDLKVTKVQLLEGRKFL